MGLPTYTLKVAIEGLVDEWKQPIPPVEVVQFKREILLAKDVHAVAERYGGWGAVAESEGNMIGACIMLLPSLTNLTPDQVDNMAGSDLVALMGIMAPFFEL